MKYTLTVKEAYTIEENDPAIMMLSEEEQPIVPANVSTPPYLSALEFHKQRK